MSVAEENLASEITKLICGIPVGNSQLSKSLTHLSQTIRNLVIELPPPHGNNTNLNPLYTPFLARSLLEASFTALVARNDPFRILTIGGAQSHSTYDPNVPSTLAFRWQGDVLAEDKSDLWGAKTKLSDVSRALLANYQETLFWKPCFERFLDHANSINSAKEWTSELQRIGITGFIPSYRGQAQSLFSRTSKGVHHEYVIPPLTYFDPDSLAAMIDDTLKVICSFAVIANFCEYLCFRLPESDAFNIYESLQP